MSNDFTQKTPVFVTVASEQEPVTVNGELIKIVDGFTLKFKLGGDAFTVVHGQTTTEVKADGVMSYDITLADAPTWTLLATPYGKIRFEVITVTRSIIETDYGFKIMLAYELNNDAADKIARAVDITVCNK